MLRARPTSPNGLQTRIAELELSVLFPCDLGDGIEVVHDVEEAIEVELDCSVDDTRDDDDADIEIEPGQTDVDLRVALGLHIESDDDHDSQPATRVDPEPAAEVVLLEPPFAIEVNAATKPFIRELETCQIVRDADSTRQFVRETDSTHQFVRESAPYERIEIQLDANAYMQATIEEARAAARRSRRN
jgi:hypothetical protein